MTRAVFNWLRRIVGRMLAWWLQIWQRRQRQQRSPASPLDTQSSAKNSQSPRSEQTDVRQDVHGDRNTSVGTVGGNVTIHQYSESRPARLGKNFQMPPLPDYFVPRPEYQDPLKASLLETRNDMPGTLVVSAVHGLGGMGKSVLAASLAHDPDVQDRFTDGILWATLGQEPDILSFLSSWIQVLGDRDYKPTQIEAASMHLRTLLYDKRVLLVVDDAWNPDHVAPFRVGGSGCRVLVTTREADVPGAHRHELKEMTPEQALGLLTKKYPGCITEEEQNQAKTLARMVGNLPLALELAAAQLNDGITLTELIEDLKAGLEALDRPGANLSEKERKNLSLVASLNLSLQRLSPEQQRQFAWLGILPEDVAITESVAATLWDITSRQAKTVLRFLRSRALLLEGAPQADQQRTYRFHDVMHEMAKRLLTSAPPAQADTEPIGLGIPRPQAHSIFLERYRGRTQNGLWHTLEDDGYIYAHLTWHLEQAGQADAIHQLLQEKTANGRNGWYVACEAIGKPASFVTDVGRAWKLAETGYEAQPARSIGLQCRYALIIASLNSLASNLPPELIAALVKTGYWQGAQGLAYVQQIPGSHQRAEAIKRIVLHLPKALLSQAIEVSRQIQDEPDRAHALRALVPYFPKLATEALEVSRQIQNEYVRARALIDLVPYSPKLATEALEECQQIQDESKRTLALSTLVPHLSKALLHQVLEISRQIQNESKRTLALSTLVPYFPDLTTEALEMSRQIQNESDRARALTALVPYFPELATEALEVSQQIQNEYALTSVLLDLVPHLPKALLFEVLEVSRQIQNATPRAHVLRALVPHLPELTTEALEVSRQIQSKSNCTRALGTLVPHFPELATEALEIARQIQNESDRTRALGTLVPHLPKAFLPQALEVARPIQDEFDRAHALGELVPHLPELAIEALEASRQIQDGSFRASALRNLVPHLPETLLPQVLEVSRQIQHKFFRAHVLRDLVPYLPDLTTEALEVSRQIQHKFFRAHVLRDLVPYLPDLTTEALEASRQIQHKFFRASALTALVPYLPDLVTEALEVSRQIQDEYYRARALNTLVPHLPEALLPQALEECRQIQDESHRVSTLTALVPYLPDLATETLEECRQIQDESRRASALSTLVPHLPEALLPQALEECRQIQDESHRVSTLTALVPYLPDLATETLEECRQIQDEYSRARALNTLVPHLPEALLPQALEVARQIQDEYSRARAFQDLATRLTQLSTEPKFLQDVLHILSHLRRPELLPTLAKMHTFIVHLGGEDALREMIKAMREVCQQWR